MSEYQYRPQVDQPPDLDGFDGDEETGSATTLPFGPGGGSAEAAFDAYGYLAEEPATTRGVRRRRRRPRPPASRAPLPMPPPPAPSAEGPGLRTLEAGNIARREGFSKDAPTGAAPSSGFELAPGVTSLPRLELTPVPVHPVPESRPAAPAPAPPTGVIRRLEAGNIARREGFTEVLPETAPADGFEPNPDYVPPPPPLYAPRDPDGEASQVPGYPRLRWGS